MIKKDEIEFLNDRKVGIVGCGHLGQSIALSLIKNGLNRETLFLSSRGNPKTQSRLQTLGLAQNLKTNQEIFQKAGIILITIRPQDLPELKKTMVPGKGLIVSCMAGVPISLINTALNAPVCRMMFSGPDTIEQESGVASMFPEHEDLKLLLRCMNLTHIRSKSENDLDVFTAGVCMPAAILKAGHRDEAQKAIYEIADEYPLFSELYQWAVSVLPHFQTEKERNQYIEKMVTKGGVTEAIINSLCSGASFDAALRAGVSRTKQISKEIQRSILSGLQD